MGIKEGILQCNSVYARTFEPQLCQKEQQSPKLMGTLKIMGNGNRFVL